MVRLQTLDLRIGVRVPASQPIVFSSAQKDQVVEGECSNALSLIREPNFVKQF